MRPGAFPKSVGELDLWRVWADQLLEQGDPRAEVISLDLSLGDAPTRDLLSAFRQRTARTLKAPRDIDVAWTLGHARTVALLPRARTRRGGIEFPSWRPGASAELLSLLSDERFAWLESFATAVREGGLPRDWHPMMAALPKRCGWLDLEVQGAFSEQVAAPLIDTLPSQIVNLRLRPVMGARVAPFFHPRFEWVDLRSMRLSVGLAAELRAAQGPRFRLGSVVDRQALKGLEGRAEVGGPDDALFVHEKTGAVALVERSPLFELQKRYGVVGIRSQLRRSLPEPFGIISTPDALMVAGWVGSHLVRQPDGSWTVRAEGSGADGFDRKPLLVLNGAEVEDTPMPLAPGDLLEIDGQPWRFQLAA